MYNDIHALRFDLLHNGCKKCDLGFQPNINGCCVARGPADSPVMIIGEAPGKNEDATRLPFTGPAGKLLDEIWQAVGMNTKDFYITNVILCRPVAEKGSGKENLTPKKEQLKRCRPYLEDQINLIRPKLIVTMGAIATAALLTEGKPIKMGDYRGKIALMTTRYNPYVVGVFPMIHPAAILHASGNKLQYDTYREQTWQDVQLLKSILIQKKIMYNNTSEEIQCQTM